MFFYASGFATGSACNKALPDNSSCVAVLMGSATAVRMHVCAVNTRDHL